MKEYCVQYILKPTLGTMKTKYACTFNIITHALVHGVRSLVHELLHYVCTMWYKTVQNVIKYDVDRSTTSAWVITKGPN